MAFYELHISCWLSFDTPLEIIHTLQYMISKDRLNEPDYIKYSKADLFKNSIWDSFLIKDNPYFPFKNNSWLSRSSNGIAFSINSSFISKTDKVIYELLDWIKPYIYLTKFLGYYRNYEGYPRHIFFIDNKFITKSVDYHV